MLLLLAGTGGLVSDWLARERVEPPVTELCCEGNAPTELALCLQTHQQQVPGPAITSYTCKLTALALSLYQQQPVAPSRGCHSVHQYLYFLSGPYIRHIIATFMTF